MTDLSVFYFVKTTNLFYFKYTSGMLNPVPGAPILQFLIRQVETYINSSKTSLSIARITNAELNQQYVVRIDAYETSGNIEFQTRQHIKGETQIYKHSATPREALLYTKYRISYQENRKKEDRYQYSS